MAELFGVEENTINYHIKEIYKSGELDENESTTRKIRVVRNEGSRTVILHEVLKENGKLRRIGPDKGGHWEVVK